MTVPLIAARGLWFAYDPDRPVLCDVDLTVTAGQRLAIVGPNGGGKTTLFRLLVGALVATRGQILVEGVELRHNRPGLLALRQRVQLVLQDPDDQLFAASVYQDVSFGPVNLGLPTAEVHRRVSAALEALEISGLADRPTHLLSFGQRKRVAIAGAIAMRPRLLIMDEPTSGLDPAGVEALLSVLEDLHRTGTTLMVSTHDVDLAHRWADDVAVVVDQGVQIASAPEVLTDQALLSRAHLTPAWAPLVGQLLDRVAGLRGARPRTPAQLAALLESGTRPDPGDPGTPGTRSAE